MQIDIVRKRSRTWIWVLMFVVVVLMLWFIAGSVDERTRGNLQDGQPHTAAAQITGTAAA